MDPRGDLGVEGQPAEAGDGQAERLGQLGRGAQDGQPGGPERIEAARPVAEPARDAAAEEHDVGGLAVRDGLGPQPLPLGGLGLLPRLDPGLLLAIGLDGRLAGQRRLMLDHLEGGPDPVHLGADGVDLGELLGREQPVGHHRPVDQLGPRVVGRRDQVAAAEPGVRPEVLALRRLLDLLAGDRHVVGRVQPGQRPRPPGLPRLRRVGGEVGIDGCRGHAEQPVDEAAEEAHANPPPAATEENQASRSGGAGPAPRFGSQRLEVAARALAQAAGEVVRAGALAPEHPAVGVEQERDGPVGHLRLRGRAGRRRGARRGVTRTGLARRVDLAAARLGILGADQLGRERHRHDLPPSVDAGVQVVDHLAEQGEPVQAAATSAAGAAGPGGDLAERAWVGSPRNAGGDRRRAVAGSGSAGGASWSSAEPPVQSLAVQPERPSISRISPIRIDQKLGSPVPSR